MNKKFALSVLFFWVFIVAIFFREVLLYAREFNISFFEALEIIDLAIQRKLVGYGLISSISFIFIYTLRPLVFFPASIMTLTSVFIFGPIQGFIISYLGELASAVITFYVGKYFGEALGLTRKPLIKHIAPYFQKNPFLSIFILRIIPLFPFDFVNYASGIFRINFKKYFYATVLGVIPGLAVFIFLSYSLVHRELFPWAVVSTVCLIGTGIWMKKKYEVTV